jgi:hypothetical protein
MGRLAEEFKEMTVRIFLFRRSLREGGLVRPWFERRLMFVKITEDVRKHAAEQGISETAALDKGLKEKSAEFVEKGAEVYAET